jgi:hypothetical protein
MSEVDETGELPARFAGVAGGIVALGALPDPDDGRYARRLAGNRWPDVSFPKPPAGSTRAVCMGCEGACYLVPLQHERSAWLPDERWFVVCLVCLWLIREHTTWKQARTQRELECKSF